MRILKKVMISILSILVFLAVFILAVILFLNFWPAVGKLPTKSMQADYAHRTQYFVDGCFTNQEPSPVVTTESEVKSKRMKPKGDIPVVKSASIPDGEKGKLYVTWLGHSSVLVQMNGKNILIDPVFCDHSSPVGFAGPKRFSELPIEPENLPHLDAVLISHDHYDHLDYKTLREINDKVDRYIVPLGVESYLIGWGIESEKITNMAWYEETALDDIRIAATPSKHYTGRNPLKRNASWWCGFYLADDSHKLYYSGDGGYCDNFKEIKEKLGEPDLALMECGQYGKGWPWIHMFPEQTVQAVNDLGAKWFIPVHWGAYCICYNSWDDSVIRSLEESEKAGVNEATPKIGERVDFDDIASYNEHWWEGIE